MATFAVCQLLSGRMRLDYSHPFGAHMGYSSSPRKLLSCQFSCSKTVQAKLSTHFENIWFPVSANIRIHFSCLPLLKKNSRARSLRPETTEGGTQRRLLPISTYREFSLFAVTHNVLRRNSKKSSSVWQRYLIL